jgi:hypothetical protein
VSRTTPTGDSSGGAVSRDSAVAVISAYGAVRLLMVLLALWTFLEGFALVTGGLDALSLGGHDRTAERIIGAQMIVVVPVYALLAWQRDRYRLLIWVPYGAQLAIILPTGWALLHADGDGALLFVVSVIFFALLFYFWWHSHPLDFFQPAEEEDAGTESDEEEELDDEPDDRHPDPGDRPRRYRRVPPGR